MVDDKNADNEDLLLSKTFRVLVPAVIVVSTDDNEPLQQNNDQVEEDEDVDVDNDNNSHRHHHHDHRRTLKLAMLGCEANPPYGPMRHTAKLFLDLIHMAIVKGYATTTIATTTATTTTDQEEYNNNNNNNNQQQPSGTTVSTTTASSSYKYCLWTISIQIFDVVNKNNNNGESYSYPIDWNEYDGYIIPGSLSSAYDNKEPWIIKLRNMIQQYIVQKQYPTLGICFGHQILAHSFSTSSSSTSASSSTSTSSSSTASASKQQQQQGDEEDCSQDVVEEDNGKRCLLGCAIQKPTGSRAGRFGMKINTTTTTMMLSSMSFGEGRHTVLDKKDQLDLFFTHNDMVATLPKTAVVLGGSDDVPIEAALYYATEQDATAAAAAASTCSATTTTTTMMETTTSHHRRGRPYAVTYQGHPEFATSLKLGIEGTLEPCLDSMMKAGAITIHDREQIGLDARKNYNKVQNDSLDAMIFAGRILGWFP